ncbi:MAG: 3-dehydroquinate synthase family protein, partial [Planctomycetota bacterium]|nr:3-dehydroquinate synthase family protein [Planctomycetota bacterium]
GVAEASIVATERRKSLATAEHLLRCVAETRHERRDPIVALGGGVVGDVAGFVAATYQRGCPVVQCPTTLLSMVDASVGGKTGVNLEVEKAHRRGGTLLKNFVGAFWQPSLVLADVRSLQSLDARHVRCGIAECIKHGMIARGVGATEDLFEWTASMLPSIVEQDEDVLVDLVARNVAVKARVVVGDEREEAASSAGGRALLNLGHTFGHAIEPLAGLSPTGKETDAPLLHGEAVGLGLVAASACAAELGMVEGEYAELVRATVEAAGLPVRVKGLPSDEDLIAAMGHDKKVRGGKLRLVLPCGDGEARVVDDPDERAVRAGIGAIRG